MLAAPTAFTVARAVHKGVAQAIGLAAASPPLPLFLLLTTLKSLEYGVLGAWLARLDARGGASLSRYAGTGLLVGLTFGGAALAATALFSPRTSLAAEWLARGINELLFPMGCAAILYAAGLAGRRALGRLSTAGATTESEDRDR